METETLQSFIESAETHLATVRSSLLIVAQSGGKSGEMAAAARSLRILKDDASEIGQTEIGKRIVDCESALDNLFSAAGERSSSLAAHGALDRVARIEAALLDLALRSEDFLSDVAGFVDASFEDFTPPIGTHTEVKDSIKWFEEEFDIDEETLDIFRTEATDLLSNIENELRTLAAEPGDQSALWNIRRTAHTFKGAAGIVGFREASGIAHRMEDLLDKMVELQREASPRIVDLLTISNEQLSSIVGAKSTGKQIIGLDAAYEQIFQTILTEPPQTNGAEAAITQHGKAPSAFPRSTGVGQTVRLPTPPVVRVSLDRLDGLLHLSSKLVENRMLVEEGFIEYASMEPHVEPNETVASMERLQSLFEIQRDLTEQIQAKLMRVRMVRFGTLETRLNRAVHVTCQEEGNNAALMIENGDFEIDTLLMDALVEPLLHLLRNAVVHGIEHAETRRLIGKPERGSITLSIGGDADLVVLKIKDDGRGISGEKLKAKAVVGGIISAEDARELDDLSTFDLIFSRGLTTAESVNLNAGRGVGMSIVKESVENRGGRIEINSTQQKGTIFTISVPVTALKHEPNEPKTNVKPDLEPKKALVLIVDDSASMRRYSTQLFESAGCRTITAQDGAEAIELLFSGVWRPDLIISDVEMPRMDGWDFLATLKNSDDLNETPVVMVTSLEGEDDQMRAFNLGAADYQIKPLNPEVVAMLIHQFDLIVK